MIVDKQLEFSDGQAVTSTAISTVVLDAGTTLDGIRNLGAGGRLHLVVRTRTAAADSGSDATLTVTLESAEDEALSVDPVVHFSTGPIPFATFASAGATLVNVPLPSGDYERYLGVRFTVNNGPLTAGNFDAFLTPDSQAWQTYANGPTV